MAEFMIRATEDAWIAEHREVWQTEMITLRRKLHQIPEPAWEERETAKLLRDALLTTGLKLIGIPECFGFLAILETGRPGPTTAFRCDMDALAVEERSGLPFASRRPGRMHACGHDFHMAVTAMLAKIAAQNSSELRGKLLFLFQPAEEDARGARHVLETGLLQAEGVEAIYGGHIWDLPLGDVLCRDDAVLAASDILRIEVRGRGGHGALPHLTRDPITAACQMVTLFQTLAARRHSPFAPLTFSICHFQAGENYNVQPERAFMEGALRSFDETLRRGFLEELQMAAEGVASALGVEVLFENRPGPPALHNTAVLAGRARQLFADSARIRLLPGTEPGMVSEDFAYYCEAFPAVFFLFGASNTKTDTRCLLHQAVNRPDEAALGLMLETYLRVLLDRHGAAGRPEPCDTAAE